MVQSKIKEKARVKKVKNKTLESIKKITKGFNLPTLREFWLVNENIDLLSHTKSLRVVSEGELFSMFCCGHR